MERKSVEQRAHNGSVTRMGFVMSAALLMTAVTIGSVKPSHAAASATRAATQRVATAAPDSGSTTRHYVPEVPVRVLDTRAGVGAPAGTVGAGQSLVLHVLGAGGIPATAVDAVVLNITAIGPTRNTYITVWPTGTSRPLASNLNVSAGTTVPNLVIAKVGADGSVSLFNNAGDVDLAADVQGWFPTRSSYMPLVPARVLDTRDGTGAPTARLRGGDSVDVSVTGLGGVPATGATSVVLNVTAVEPTTNTYVTVWPTGTDRPFSPSLDVQATATVANVVIARVGENGKVSLFDNAGSVDLVVDVQGYFTGTDGYAPVVASRVLDTRNGTGAPLAAVGAGRSLDVAVLGLAGIPASGVGAVVMNVTAVTPTRDTFVTVWPTGADRPVASNLNIADGSIASNEVIATIGANGKVSLFNNAGDTDLVVDVQGWLPASTASEAPTPSTVPNSTVPPDSTTSTTSTTTPGPTATTTTAPSPDSTTTTSTVPPGDSTTTTSTTVLPPSGIDLGSTALAPGWQFLPRNTTLTHAGESKVVHLVLADDSGVRTNTPVPDSFTLASVGDTGVMSIVQQSDGSIKVTALSADVGTVVLAAKIPGQLVGPSTTLTVAHFQPGVVQLTDDQVLFPRVTGPDDVNPFTRGLVGPFTTAEMSARTDIPDATEAQDPAFIVDPHETFPMVLVGDAPAAGSIIASVGSFQGFGRIIEPTGLATLSRSGYSLVSVSMVPFQVAFVDLHMELNAVDLQSIGAVASTHTLDYQCTTADPTTCPLTASPADGVTDAEPQPLTPATQGAPGPSRAVHSRAAAPATAPQTLIPGTTCDATGAVAGAEVKPFTINAQFEPVFDLKLVIIGSHVQAFIFQTGFITNVQAGMSMKLQGTLEGQIECTLAEKTYEKFAPGYAALAISAFIDVKLLFRAALTLKAGPGVSYSPMCFIYKRVVVGFQVRSDGVVTPITDNPAVQAKCDGDNDTELIAFVTGGDAGAVPASVEFKAGPVLSLPLGIRVGGILTKFLGLLFDVPRLGMIPLVVAEFTPQVRLTWENIAQTVVSKTASSFYGIDFKAVLNTTFGGALNMLVKSLVGNAGHVIAVPLAELSIPLIGRYLAINPQPSPADPEMSVSVNGVEKSTTGKNVVRVHPGDRVSITATVYRSNAIDAAPITPITGSTTYRLSNHDSVGFLRGLTGAPVTDLYRMNVTGSDVVDNDTCSALKDDDTLLLIGETKMERVIPTPAFIGQIRFTCDPSMRFDPSALAFSAVAIHSTQYTHLRGIDTAGTKWKLSGMPDWLLPDASSGAFVGDNDASSSQIGFTIDCAGFQGQQLSAKVTATTVDSQLDAELTAYIQVTTDCRKGFITIDPSAIGGSGGAASMTTKGDAVQAWQFSGVPSWATITPASGSFAANPDLLSAATIVPLTVTITPPPPTCENGDEETATATVAAGDRGEATLMLTRPAPARKDKCVPATGDGDPHFRSFDGNHFDAMVIGEYTFFASPTLATPDPSVEPVALHARQEQTRANTPIPATSIVAIAYTEKGHRIEAYARPAWKVLVDGVDVTTMTTSPIAVDTGLSVDVSLASIVIDGDAHVTVNLDGFDAGAILDVSAATNDPTLRGMLGNSDGDKANDLMLSTGELITEAQAQLHDTDLYRFTNSWRVTDIAKSLFTDPSPSFTEGNPPYSSAALEPYRQAARDALGKVSRLCDGAGNAYLVDALALEIAIGTAPATLGQYSCEYIVRGTAKSGTTPVGAVRVTVDAPGLKACTTTTSADGTYYCSTKPDINELAALPAGDLAPLDVSVSAAFGINSAFSTQHVTFAQLVPLSSSTTLTSNIDVPAALLATAHVSGRITVDGAPTTQAVSLQIVAYGGPLGYDVLGQSFARALTMDADGRYSVDYLLPYGTTHVHLTSDASDYGPDRFEQDADVAPFGAQPIDFGFDYSPPRLHVHGTISENGVASPHVVGVEIVGFSDLQMTRYEGRFQETPTLDADGNYSFDGVAQRLARYVVATVHYDTTGLDDVTTPFTVTPGQNDLQFDAIEARTTLHFSGAVTVEGSVPVGTYRIAVAVTKADGSELDYTPTITPDPTTGAYTLDQVLPLGATTVAYRAVVPDVPAEFNPLMTLTPLTPGAQNVEYTIDVAKTTLSMSGTLRYHGTPLVQSPNSTYVYAVTFTITGKDSTRAEVYHGSEFAYTDPNGMYQFTRVLPAGIESVVVTVRPFYPGYTVTGTYPIVSHADNPAVLDGDGTTLIAHGAITSGGPPVGDDVVVPVTFEGFDAAGNSLGSLDEGNLQVSNSEYSVQDVIPVTWDHAVVRFGPNSEFTTGTGHIDVTADVDVPYDLDIGSGSITISGAATFDGAGYTGNAAVTITPYSVNFDNAKDAPPYTQLAPFTQTVSVQNGRYSTTPVLSPGANFVRVDVVLDGTNGYGGDTNGFRIELGVGNITFDVAQTSPYTGVALVLGGTTDLTGTACASDSFIYSYEMYSLPDQAGGASYDGTTGTYPNGTLMKSGYAIPDPATGKYSLYLGLPAGAAAVGIVKHTLDEYGPQGFETSTSADTFGIPQQTWVSYPNDHTTRACN